MHKPLDAERHPLVRKLESIVDLTADEEEAVRGLPMIIRALGPDQDLAREGDRPSQSCLVLEGIAFRYKMLGDGRRQIMAFHVAGDLPDVQSLHLEVMDHSLAVLDSAQVGFIQHQHLRDLTKHCPRVAGALWRDTLIDAAIFREWMVGIGRKEAPARIAHLLCELYLKMEAVGLAADHVAPMPITQGEFADALGLSAVHVNRSLQELRARKLITLTRKTLTIDDWDGLVEAGEFDPAYLHLNPKRRPEAV